ncbi:pentatricopeptide repeat-containing protein [Panicum miliaceum]|uniref:Pentatricopeptide repeat-containing protein n=1 Tax=Panicum miliaceum TaxID=4540 RepID=A0A3L6QI10_PANMI|nr:pentatricopeptide repeat-containing protein [Panicum miliaceum]
MAALAILLRHGRRAHAHGLRLSHALSTATAGTDPGTISVSNAKQRLRREFDPDRAVSILEAIDKSSMSAGATRNALSVAARRLSRARRFADAEALISSYLPACTTEPYLAAVLCSYASANLPEKALDAFRSTAPSLPTPISPLPFNALLSTLLRCRCHHQIPALFAELSKEFSITPNNTSYGILVKAYCMNRDHAKAKQTLDQMREQGISPTTKTYTTLMDSMYKQKKAEEAELLWKEMVESGCKPDVAAYNVKVTNFGLHGKLEEVMEVMKEMEADGVKPDIITYNFLMTSYCKNGKLEDAMVLYHSLAEKGCSANAATYKHMLAALCENGDFDAGLGIFEESLKRNKIPDFRTMKGLVEGLVKGGQVTEAKKVAAEMHKRFPNFLLSGWKNLEEELGLDSDSGDASHSECTSGKIVAEAKSVAADAETFELKGSVAEETAVSEESSDDEASVPKEVPRGPA